jgi:hypothetical protein
MIALAWTLVGELTPPPVCGYSIRKEGDKQIAAGPEIIFTLIPEMPNARESWPSIFP